MLHDLYRAARRAAMHNLALAALICLAAAITPATHRIAYSTPAPTDSPVVAATGATSNMDGAGVHAEIGIVLTGQGGNLPTKAKFKAKRNGKGKGHGGGITLPTWSHWCQVTPTNPEENPKPSLNNGTWQRTCPTVPPAQPTPGLDSESGDDSTGTPATEPEQVQDVAEPVATESDETATCTPSMSAAGPCVVHA